MLHQFVHNSSKDRFKRNAWPKKKMREEARMWVFTGKKPLFPSYSQRLIHWYFCQSHHTFQMPGVREEIEWLHVFKPVAAGT